MPHGSAAMRTRNSRSSSAPTANGGKEGDVAQFDNRGCGAMRERGAHDLEVAGTGDQRIAAAHAVLVEQPVFADAELRRVQPLVGAITQATFDERVPDRRPAA